MVFFGAFSLLLDALCIWEGASLASLPLCVYRAWVAKACLLDTPFGRRSVEAVSL